LPVLLDVHSKVMSQTCRAQKQTCRAQNLYTSVTTK
jgi:hypothetical protein